MKLRRIMALCLVLLLTCSLFVSCEKTTREEETTEGIETTGGDTTDETTEGESEATPKKRVALTFDDGPQHYEERTKAIVDELSKYGFTATFFVVGNRIAGGDALSYMVEKGCEIGIHGFTHEIYYDTCTDAQYENEIGQTLERIERAVPGYNVRLIRPIGGRISEARLAASPYSVIMWSVDPEDYEYRYSKGDSDEVADGKVNAIVENVMSSVEDGDVILMHDIYESTYDATVILLRRLYEEGYEVVTVSELFGDELTAGRSYRRKG